MVTYSNVYVNKHQQMKYYQKKLYISTMSFTIQKVHQLKEKKIFIKNLKKKMLKIENLKNQISNKKMKF